MQYFVRGSSSEASVWSVDVVELLPHGQLLPEVDIVGVVEQLVELKFVGQVRALDLPLRFGLAGLM